MNETKVLVTDGSGYLGAHMIVRLLEAGNRVRATIRSSRREPDVRAMVATGGMVDSGDRLEFAEADLTIDEGWEVAVARCDYVLHPASVSAG